MRDGASTLKSEIGYNPTRFMQMVGEHGGLEAARRLLTGPDASDGFTILWKHHRLNMSVEAFALLPWYRHLFSEDQLSKAQYRLTEHGFDVVKYLAEAQNRVPNWFHSE
jgi:hypothetical protein